MNPVTNQAPNDRPVTTADPLDDPRLTQALEEYEAALEAGVKPDRRALLARYADIAGPLANCLESLEMLHATGSQLQPESKRPRPLAADPGRVDCRQKPDEDQRNAAPRGTVDCRERFCFGLAGAEKEIFRRRSRRAASGADSPLCRRQ